MNLACSAFSIFGCVLLNIIHGFYYIYLLVYSVYCNVLRRTRFLYYDIILSSQNTNTCGVTDNYSLQKIPKHLAIIIGSECVYYKDLVKLISWCSQFGVKFISFYHHSNCIQPVLLYETFCKANKESLRKIVWNKSFENIKEQVKKDLNGYKRPDPSELLRVNVFTTKEGQSNLVETTKLIAERCWSADEITQQSIDEIMHSKIMAPDPDLALVFGDTYSSFGFLPWHLRVTEFVNFHTHHNITSGDFIRLLERYSKCDQRFGK